jgi:hypothetical protein
MKFDENGRRVSGSASVQILNGLSPELVGEFTSLGVTTSSLGVITDMVSAENSGKAFEIILRMAKSQVSDFSVGDGRNF